MHGRKPVLVLGALVVAIASYAGETAGAAAQESEGGPPTRVNRLTAAREAKRQTVTAPTRTIPERGLRSFRTVADTVHEGWFGLRPTGGDFPTGAGFSAGVAFRHQAIGSAYAYPELRNRFDFEAAVARSTAGYEQVAATFTARNVAGWPVGAAVSGTYYEFPEEDFFGLGPTSLEEDRTSYLLESRELYADLWWEPHAGLQIGTTIAYLSPTIGPGTDGRFPSTDQIFSPLTVPGFVVQPDFRRLDAWVEVDTRDNAFYTRAGGVYQARVSHFEDHGLNAFTFYRSDWEVQHYIPLSQEYRVIALRAKAVLTGAPDRHDVPFYYQPTLGGKNTLRGFREFRFRDRNSLLLTAEYRWQAWRILEPAVFVDAGTVAPRWSDVHLNRLDVSYGIGFRFHTSTRFLARLDLAKSREGFIPYFKFDHVF